MMLLLYGDLSLLSRLDSGEACDRRGSLLQDDEQL
jgi:hypothetical protein